MRKIVLFILQLVFLYGVLFFSSWNNVKIENPQFLGTDGSARNISLPFSEDYTGFYTIRISIDSPPTSSQEFRIIPDDELVGIRLNGQPIDISHISINERRDYGNGFKIMLNNLNAQSNTLEADIINSSNPTSFRIEPTSRISFAKALGIALLLMGFSWCTTRFVKITNKQQLALFIGIIFSTIYLSKTDVRTRTFDVFEGGGHRDYIEYIIKNHSYPNPGEGWEYHQPPLYYTLAAAAKMALPSKISLEYQWAQALALCFWSVFLVGSMGIFNAIFKNRQSLSFAISLLLVSWPAGIIHSIRIGNDTPLYAFYSLSLYFIYKWWFKPSANNFLWATVWAGAAVITKSNGIALLLLLGGLLVIRHLRPIISNKDWRIVLLHKNNILLLIFTGIVALGINFGDNLSLYFSGKTSDWLLSNVSQSINSGLKVSNAPSAYLIFDWATYIQNPFISTWEDKYGRQYFWNFLIRSSLSSEFSFQGKSLEYWGIFNGLLLSLALFGTFIALVQSLTLKKLHQIFSIYYKHLPLLGSALLLLLLLLSFRIKVPLSCNTDFRYIYPFIISILPIFGFLARKNSNYIFARLLNYGIFLIIPSTVYWLSTL